MKARGYGEDEIAKLLGLTLPTLRRYQAAMNLHSEFLNGYLLRRISSTAMLRLTRLSDEGQAKALAVYRREGRLLHRHFKQLTEGKNPAWRRYRAAIKALLKAGVTPEELRLELENTIGT